MKTKKVRAVWNFRICTQFWLIFTEGPMFGFFVIPESIFHGFQVLDFIDFWRKTLGLRKAFSKNQVFVTLFDELDLRVEMLDFSSVKNSGKFGYGTVVFYWTRWCLASSYPPPCRILFELVVFYSILQVFELFKKIVPREGIRWLAPPGSMFLMSNWSVLTGVRSGDCLRHPVFENGVVFYSLWIKNDKFRSDFK